MNNLLQTYLSDVWQIYSTGAATKETSFYTPLANLFNRVGDSLKPRIKCVVNIKNQGAGIPDGGFFTASQLKKDEENPLATLPPKRGVLEVKSAREDVEKIAQSGQSEKYLRKYGQVLVTNLRDFLLLAKDENGATIRLERFTLADSENEFREMLRLGLDDFAGERETRFAEYLKRVFLHAAPIAAPEEVAFFLASYARDAKARIEANKDFPALENLKNALAEALGIRFTDEKGEKFFRSTLVQTLFYGIFSAWVLHSRKHQNKQKFDWHTAAWELRVPMIRALFEQIATPSKLKPLGLTEVLDWASAVLNRVNKAEFFRKFEQEHAVQYFYEPFLQAFDPELRKELGVWYTPEEIVRYMVERVDRTLREELHIADGLANENVFVLDPCCGTGAYLVEVLRRIDKTLKQKGADALSGGDLKRAACERIFGFEILPAPFVVAHLQLGLILQNLGSPLDDDRDERVGVYLTNALTGWNPAKEPKTHLLFPEMEGERDRAEAVKRDKPILVILGNPPYNAFAGTSPKEEQGLVDVYKKNLNKPESEGGWGIKKFNLDELYVRFFRLAERRIAGKQPGQGIVCFVSNFSYLSDPSFVVMRERLLGEFDELWFDNLNGDSRETGKTTPDGKPDPSIFSTEYNKAGIRVGTAIGLLVRKAERGEKAQVHYREFWGKNKREQLEMSEPPASAGGSTVSENPPADAGGSDYVSVNAARENRFSFRPSNVSDEYKTWARLTEISAIQPVPGMAEDRKKSLIQIDKKPIESLMKDYFDSYISWENFQAKNKDSGLTKDASRFVAKEARKKLQQQEVFDESRIVRFNHHPFDLRWAYVSYVRPLWSEPIPSMKPHFWEGNYYLISRMNCQIGPEGFPLYLTKNLFDRQFSNRNPQVFPFFLRAAAQSKESQPSLLGETEETFTANLSAKARNYLHDLGADDPDESADAASLIWLHALAIGYAPLYLTENADGIRSDFPRILLPAELEILQTSARRGRRIAELLDTERATAETDGLPFIAIGVISRVAGGQIRIESGELEISAGWGSGGKGGITMPGKGKTVKRDYTPEELKILEESAARFNLSAGEITQILGAQTFDVYLNDAAFWRNIPAAVWEYTIGGYQVLKKWLSYREAAVLGRSLTADEAREVSSIVRRITAILLLSKDLNANYKACKSSEFKL